MNNGVNGSQGGSGNHNSPQGQSQMGQPQQPQQPGPTSAAGMGPHSGPHSGHGEQHTQSFPRPYPDSPSQSGNYAAAPQSAAAPGVQRPASAASGVAGPGVAETGPAATSGYTAPKGASGPGTMGSTAGYGADGAPASAGVPGPHGAPGVNGPAGFGTEPAQNPGGKKRWSTPALAALLLAGAVAASATTAVVMDQTNALDSSRNATSSFDTAPGQGQNTEAASKPVTPGSTEDIASRVLPSVVSIQTMTRQGGGEGSGSIFSSDGMILTNNHVVAGAENGGEIQVRLHDGRILPAKVVATDPQTDIAVIKAEGATDLKPIELGDSNKLNVGEDVIAIGSPLGLASTVTTGIVSAKNRPVQAAGERGGEASLIDAIQTDAAINPGNSGGVLVDMEGKLVGVPSVIATLGGAAGQQSGSIGLGFAIPSNQAQRIAKDLIDKGEVKHPVIGAKVNTASERFGAEIVDVTDGSPAEKAGLKDGEVVTRVGDRLVESGVGLIAAIRSHQVGDTVKLTVTDERGKNEHTIDVTLEAE